MYYVHYQILFNRTGEQTANEIALHRKEDHKRYRNRNKGGGGENFPIAAACSEQLDNLVCHYRC